MAAWFILSSMTFLHLMFRLVSFVYFCTSQHYPQTDRQHKINKMKTRSNKDQIPLCVTTQLYCVIRNVSNLFQRGRQRSDGDHLYFLCSGHTSLKYKKAKTCSVHNECSWVKMLWVLQPTSWMPVQLLLGTCKTFFFAWY